MPLSILKLIAKMAYHIVRRGHGIFKILFVIDDFIRVFTMTILFIILCNWLNLSVWIMLPAAFLGLAIDVHDFISDNELAKFFD